MKLHAKRYGGKYRKKRAAILSRHPRCVYCGAKANSVDHAPPISTTDPSRWRGVLRPSCLSCNFSRGATYGNKKRARH
jgi:hypothetical protein